MNSSVSMMTWNVKSGGFDNYDPTLKYPTRQDDIANVINTLHETENIGLLTLPDTHRWDEVYGDDASIAKHLGYAAARFIRLDDERLSRNNGAGIGITFATDHPIEQTSELDLETRKGISNILNIGGKALQIASVYLDDLSEDVRVQQVRALHAGLEPELPTVLMGDFNSLRNERGDPVVRGAALGGKVLGHFSHRLPSKIEGLRQSVVGMNDRRAIPELLKMGYRDSDERLKRRTAPSQFPQFGIDYIFSNSKVELGEPRVINVAKASDHRAVIAKATITH